MGDTTTQIYQQTEPEWMVANRKALLADVKGATSKPPETMATYQVAGMSPEQQNAVAQLNAQNAAGQGIGGYKPYLQQAGQSYSAGAGYLTAGTQAYDPNSVAAYMNPYQQQVTQNAMAEMNRQAAIQNQGVAAQAVKAGAFGGSRFGVQQAELGRNLAQVQGQQILQDYSQNYSQAQQAAMGAFQNQQQRMQNAGQGLATIGQGIQSLGQTSANLGQGDISFGYNMGANLQGQDQKVLDAQRLNQQMYNAEPYQRLSYYADILNKTPSGQMGMTQSTAPTPSPFSQIAGLGIAGIGAYNATKGMWGGT
jgi:hypothetical protein